MKKTYIQPNLQVLNVITERMVAESLTFGTTSIESEEDVMVKGASAPHYDVWDDDWSAE